MSTQSRRRWTAEEKWLECVLRFSQQGVDLALRRQRSAEARASGQNLRSAVEATVRSVKHPFDDGRVQVRLCLFTLLNLLGSLESAGSFR